MNTFLQLTAHDPLIARDGRPFGAGQGNRMRGLPWPLPSVVAGSFRSALVKAGSGDFSGNIPERLLRIAVAGVFPVHDEKLYLPAPNDCAWSEKTNIIHRVQPIKLEAGEGVDFPDDASGLRPVRLTADQSKEEFKAKTSPAWWPLNELTAWLTSSAIEYPSEWFTDKFFSSPLQETRDHVCLDAERGAAAEGRIFATAGLNVAHLPKFGVKPNDKDLKFDDRFARVALSARVIIPNSETALTIGQQFGVWHPLGGERRLVHWTKADSKLWECPDDIKSALKQTTKVRMILATPAIFKHGWKPDLADGPLKGFGLNLIGASVGRWKAVSGWSLAKINDKGELDPNGKPGPKLIRRMAPAGSVYFFECEQGAAAKLADEWLQPMSDDSQVRRDGFGLAAWGTW